MKHLYIYLLLLLLSPQLCSAQTWQWGRRGGANNDDPDTEKIIDLATDRSGNIYVLSVFQGNGNTATLDGAASLLQLGGIDILLASYNCQGQLRWKKTFGAIGQSDQANALAIDSLGGVYITGRTSNNSPQFDTDTIVPSNSTKTFFIVKYDTLGNYHWLSRPSPDTATLVRQSQKFLPYDMVPAPGGGVYLLAYMGSGLLADGVHVLPQDSTYIIRFSANGSILETIPMDMGIVRAPGGTNFTSIRMVHLPNGKFIISGYVYATGPTYNFNFSMGGQAVTRPMFIGCFASNGGLLWKRGNSLQNGGGFRYRPVLHGNGVLLTGSTISANPSSSFIRDTLNGYAFLNTVTSGLVVTPFVAKLDTLSGATIWITNAEVNGAVNSVGGLALSGSNVFTTGSYGLTFKWGSQSLISPSNIGYDIFIAQLDAATGTVNRLDSLDGNQGYDDFINAIVPDGRSGVYLGGQLGNSLNTGNMITSIGGANDFFVARYGLANCNSAVPIKVMSFTGNWQGGSVHCQWRLGGNGTIHSLALERSIDGSNFHTLAVLPPTATNYIDVTATTQGSRLYYRLKLLEADGAYAYSNVALLQASSTNIFLHVHPVPLLRGTMASASYNLGNEKGELELLDAVGIRLWAVQVNGIGSIQLPTSKLTTGAYLLKLRDKMGRPLANSKFVVQ